MSDSVKNKKGQINIELDEKSRIVLTPQHAKRFLKALNDNVKRFEDAHGKIKDFEQPPIPLNFGPTGEA